MALHHHPRKNDLDLQGSLCASTVSRSKALGADAWLVKHTMALPQSELRNNQAPLISVHAHKWTPPLLGEERVSSALVKTTAMFNSPKRLIQRLKVTEGGVGRVLCNRLQKIKWNPVQKCSLQYCVSYLKWGEAWEQHFLTMRDLNFILYKGNPEAMKMMLRQNI